MLASFPIAPVIEGFLLGGSLIIAIGAQNAFVLRQGLLRSHVLILCLICALSDALLIAVGVAGLGTVDRTKRRIVKASGYRRQPVFVCLCNYCGAAGN